MFRVLFFIFFSVYHTRTCECKCLSVEDSSSSFIALVVYALPSPQQSMTLAFFGEGSNFVDSSSDDTDGDSVVTQFLVPSGTSGGGDQTTFEFVEVDSTIIESLSGTATVTETSLTTITGMCYGGNLQHLLSIPIPPTPPAELIASASGFVFDATVTEVNSGKTITATFTEACQATATDNSGECEVEVNGISLTITGTPSPQLIVISGAPTATPAFAAPVSSITPDSPSTSAGTSPTPQKNDGFKREFDHKMLVGMVAGMTILGIVSGGHMVL